MRPIVRSEPRYTVTLKRPTEVAHVPVRRRRVRLLLAAIRRPKYQGIVMAQYAAGLRISAACRLRPEDIDSKRMVIHVSAGKGDRDRYAVLSARLLTFLRDYFRQHRPDGWLFPGRPKAGHRL